MPDIEHGNVRSFVSPAEVLIELLFFERTDAPVAPFGLCNEAELVASVSRFVHDQWVHFHTLGALGCPQYDAYPRQIVADR